MIEAIRNIKRAWAADLLAPSWFLAPTKRLMLLVAPLPRPTLTPFNIMKIGVTKPIPAIAAWPRPATQIPSMILYDAVRSIEIMIGIARVFTAFSGFPLINSTFLFAILIPVIIYLNYFLIIGFIPFLIFPLWLIVGFLNI